MAARLQPKCYEYLGLVFRIRDKVTIDEERNYINMVN
jgi:hypothetical protein